MSIDYIRKVDDIYHNVEVDGDGGTEISIRGANGEEELVCLDFEELDRIYTMALSHRIAYKMYRNRDYENEDRYHFDFDWYMKWESLRKS